MPEASKFCPFVKKPQKECFCSDMNSGNVEYVIVFCMGNFQDCEIYRREMLVMPSI